MYQYNVVSLYLSHWYSKLKLKDFRVKFAATFMICLIRDNDPFKGRSCIRFFLIETYEMYFLWHFPDYILGPMYIYVRSHENQRDPCPIIYQDRRILIDDRMKMSNL